MAVLTSDQVRMFMRDYASATASGLTHVFNELLEHVAFTEAEIELAMQLAVSKYNVTGFITSETVGSFPEMYLLLIGTVSNLLFSNSMLQARNQLDYNDGGEHHGYSDKYQAYLTLSENLKREWDAMVPAYKASKNMEQAYGSLASAYAGFGYPTLIQHV